MSGLASIGASAIKAYQTALATVSSNVANSQTPGYVRRTTSLAELPPGGDRNLPRFNGVVTTAVTRQYDAYLSENVRRQTSEAATANSRSDGLTRIEQSLDLLKDGIGTSIGRFYDAAQSLAAQPSSVASQRIFRDSLAEAARQFRTTASAVSQTAAELMDAAEAQRSAANEELANLALVNGRIQRERPGSAAHASLLDERDRLLDGLSSRLAITTTFAENGMVRIEAAQSSVALLDGVKPSVLTLERGQPGAVIRATSDAGTMTFSAAGGSIAGMLLAARTAELRIAEIDQLADDFATHVNMWSAQGLTSTGQPGGTLLSGTSASELETAPGLDGALPMQGNGQANGNLLALIGNRASAGFEARWTEIAGGHSMTTASARAQAKLLDATLEAATLKRAELSGVDLDREAADLMRYQQAYNAAARILKTADDVINTILNIA